MKQTKYLVYWNPYEEEIEYSKAEYFDDLFRYQQNVVTIDLKNNKDPRSLKLLREADLVVVFMKQSVDCFDAFFSKDYIPGEKVLLVVTDYISDGTPEWPGVLGQYRIPKKRLFFLPFHNRLQYVKEQGLMHQYVQGQYNTLSYEKNRGFYQGFKELRERIYYSLA